MFVTIPLFETIIESLKYCCTNKGLNLHAYVIMPNHTHYIISTDPPEKLSDIMRDFNRFTSQRITDVLEEMRRNELLETFHKAAVDEGRGNRYRYGKRDFILLQLTREISFNRN